ncbi:cytochrome b [Algirhabdus cladophorae]|uniref:cytochrome b n=1 Tax=Algirhabdus cladophorae TaxID=3377108 RepID=UPI003B846482
MVQGYSKLQIRLHWAVVVLVALQLIFHEGMSNAYAAGMKVGNLTFSTPVILHFIFGTTITALMLWRLMMRQERGVPPAPEGEPKQFQLAGKLAHVAFYVVLLLLPVTGAVAWGGANQGAANVHEILKFILLALIAAHIGAALIHQFVWKTDLLDRMRTPDPDA